MSLLDMYIDNLEEAFDLGQFKVVREYLRVLDDYELTPRQHSRLHRLANRLRTGEFKTPLHN